MNNEVGIQSIGQIAIAVSDITEATNFYRDPLGLKLLFEAPPGLAFFDCGGVRRMVTTKQGQDDHRTSVIDYNVGNIDAANGGVEEPRRKVYPRAAVDG
ncbi:MAG: VOC family protein [Pseudohongiellaceae bacterium]